MSRVGREVRLEMAKRFESGELSKAKFCESEGVSVSTLDYWRHQLQAEGEPRFMEAEFTEVSPPRRVASKSLQVELELPMGIVLRIFGTNS